MVSYSKLFNFQRSKHFWIEVSRYGMIVGVFAAVVSHFLDSLRVNLETIPVSFEQISLRFFFFWVRVEGILVYLAMVA